MIQRDHAKRRREARRIADMDTDPRAWPDQARSRPITKVACWAHTRRGFFDEWEQHKSPTARQALDRIAAINQTPNAPLRESGRSDKAAYSQPAIAE